MLKVVGASWEKTRLTSIMLGTVSAIAIFAIFFFELPPEGNDGNYAATVSWVQNSYKIEFWGQGNDPRYIRSGAARAYYKSDMKSTGWASLEIETNSKYPDRVQAHAAGLVEGSLCWQVIYWQWQNTVGNICQEREDYCHNVRKFIKENKHHVIKLAKERDSDPFWHQVNLFYEQLDGLEVGWRYGVERSRKNKEIDIDSVDFLWMNSLGDLKDLEMIYDFSPNVQPSGKPLSIALLKLVDARSSDKRFLMAHASAGYYIEMLRLQKRYNFGFHWTQGNKSQLVPGRSIQFTSYPGSLHSQDDFYHVSGAQQMIVSGTAIKNYNSDLWKGVDPKQLMLGARVMAANRLAVNGSEWAKYVSLSNSGTGNKQWIVVKSNTSNLDTWIVDQLPGKTAIHNVTELLHKKGYLTSFGLPYDEELKDLVGYKKAGVDIVNFFDSTESILQEGQQNIIDEKSLANFMRGPKLAMIGRSDIVGDDSTVGVYGPEFIKISSEIDGLLAEIGARTETGDRTKLLVADKPIAFYNSPENAIIKGEASRGKEADPPTLKGNGVLRKELNGNTDLKISTGKPSTFRAVAGPPFTQSGQYPIDPFQWSKSLFSNVCHQGQPDVWNFDAVEVDWAWD